MRFRNYDITRADQYNIVLSTVAINQKTGEEYLSQPKYFNSWEKAIERALELGLKSEDANQILADIKKAKQEIIEEILKVKKLV